MGEIYHSGVVAILGAPNAGKSTLFNRLLGQKLAIVSPKPQTTRNRMMGVLHGSDYQIIFLDTPGLHKPGEELNRRMVRAAQNAAEDADLLVFLADAAHAEKEGLDLARRLDFLPRLPHPLILALNKVDLLRQGQGPQLIKRFQDDYPFAAVLPLSALKGEGVDAFVQALVSRLPEGPRYYPDDMLTDVSERFLAAEIVRESIFLRTREEVPYSTAVLIDLFDETVQPLRIVATIVVARPSQKGIIIGKGGAMLGEIRRRASAELHRVLARPLRLELWVKVQKDWTGQDSFLKRLGLPG